MRGVVVQRVEVVVDELDLGSLVDLEPQAAEHILDLPPRRGQQVQVTDRCGRVPGQRDVRAVAREAVAQLGRLEIPGTRGDQRLEPLARLVGGLPDLPALRRLEVGDPAQEVRQLGLAPEEAHPQLLELGRGDGGADGRFGLGPDGVDALDHAAGTLEIS